MRTSQGLHYGAGGLVVAELIDPETGVVKPMEQDDGRTRVHDAQAPRLSPDPFAHPRHGRVFTDPCACGRTSFRFHALGRSDDMFIVKGMNIFPLSVQESLLLLRPEVTGEFFIILDSAPPIDDSPRICVEIAEGLPPARLELLRRNLSLRSSGVRILHPH